jgi:hypothetical protein
MRKLYGSVRQLCFGLIPPMEGKLMYMARVDRMLTFCPDVEKSLVQKLTDVQHFFIWLLLGIGPRSMLAILFTETGIIAVKVSSCKTRNWLSD